MKVIKGFRKEDYGLLLDLEDADASVAVDTTTGDILLNEGAGEDRFHNAAISRSAFHEFCLEELPGSEYQLTLKHGLTGSHVLGVTGDKKQAETWVREATSAIRSPLKLKGLPVRRPPFTLPKKCAPPFCYRVRNTRARDTKFVLEPWGERYTMQPLAAIDVVFHGPPGERPEIEVGDGAITVNASHESLVRLFVVSFGELPGASPSEIVEEEVRQARQFGKFELSEDGAARLKKALRPANDTFDVLLASDPLDRKSAGLWCGTIAKTLAESVHCEIRLKRETVWRVCARMLQLVDLALELFESASGKLLSLAETGHDTDIWQWLETRTWDGRTPLEPSVPKHGIPSDRVKR